ncbi:cysteine-rich CWC family protein [Marinomonas spartinae]|uniref:cysteine-rich CWC family protein n=1 Tax=Marinomonas spartinae TaxID=1792290 RepID=UPI0018F10A8B|nr:cysteine-rich CWC family protein [Marinomonas spartinae]
MVQEKSEAICPICARANACNAQDNCWCFHDIVPDSLLALLATHHIDRRCVCQTCIDCFKSDPEHFEQTYFTR